MKKIAIMVLMALTLVGCASAKVETERYSGSMNGVEVEVSLEFESDKMLKQETKSHMNYAKMGLKKSQVETLTNSYKKKYDIKGVDYQVDITDSTVTETTSIDYKNADIEELTKAEIIMTPKDGKKAKYVSYKETIKNIKASGLNKK